MTITEQTIRDRAHAINVALADTGIDYDIFYEEDGDEGWHITIQAGAERYINEMGEAREYGLTYWTRDQTWYWETVDEGSRRTGPWPLRELAADAAPSVIAEHVRLALRDAETVR